MEQKQLTIKTIISTASIILVAVLGSIFVNLGIDWFNLLHRPTQWIPNIIIPIVWTVIYLSFAIINYLWLKNGGINKNAVVLMIINGILNVLWCLIFFTLRQLFLGDIVIIVNIIFGILLWVQINKTQKIYSYVLALYPIWLCIATTLNLALWILN